MTVPDPTPIEPVPPPLEPDVPSPSSAVDTGEDHKTGVARARKNREEDPPA
jgi:hypothetical protein